MYTLLITGSSINSDTEFLANTYIINNLKFSDFIDLNV